jgi:hypothetical protein
VAGPGNEREETIRRFAICGRDATRRQRSGSAQGVADGTADAPAGRQGSVGAKDGNSGFRFELAVVAAMVALGAPERMSKSVPVPCIHGRSTRPGEVV